MAISQRSPDEFATGKLRLAAWLTMMGHSLDEIRVVPRRVSTRGDATMALFVFRVGPDDRPRLDDNLQRYRDAGIEELVATETDLKRRMFASLGHSERTKEAI